MFLALFAGGLRFFLAWAFAFFAAVSAEQSGAGGQKQEGYFGRPGTKARPAITSDAMRQRFAALEELPAEVLSDAVLRGDFCYEEAGAYGDYHGGYLVDQAVADGQDAVGFYGGQLSVRPRE